MICRVQIYSNNKNLKSFVRVIRYSNDVHDTARLVTIFFFLETRMTLYITCDYEMLWSNSS